MSQLEGFSPISWGLHSDLDDQHLPLHALGVCNVLDVSDLDELGELLDEIRHGRFPPSHNDREEGLVDSDAHREGLDVGPSSSKDACHSVDQTCLIGHKDADHVFLLSLL